MTQAETREEAIMTFIKKVPHTWRTKDHFIFTNASQWSELFDKVIQHRMKEKKIMRELSSADFITAATILSNKSVFNSMKFFKKELQANYQKVHGI
jgi:hypothetical protein